MGMNLEVYDRKDPTKRIGVVPLKLKPRFLEEVSGVGGGSFDVRSSDKRITALQERNIVKVRVNGKIVSGFIITSVRPKMIDSGEFSTEITTITGKGLKQWTEDATVFPHGGLKATSGDERSFNFASPKDPTASLNTWLPTKSWVKPAQIAKVHAKDSPWGTKPKDWPDYPSAYWVWAPRPFKKPEYPGAPVLYSGDIDVGTCYFRYDFTVASAGKYSFFVAADDIYEVYVDGQLLANASPGADNYSKTQRIDFDLDKGAHVIGVKVHNTGGVGGFIGALGRFGNAAGKKESTTIAVTNSNTWKVIPFPYNNPGWTPGEIMNQLVAEAKDRGVWWAKFVKPTFTGAKDSNGQAWERELDYSFNVGESYLSVINKFAELSCDVWIDPADYTLNMAAMRGQDLADTSKGSKIIQLRKGRDLLGADQSVEANIKNALIVDTSTGKIYQKDNASIAKYGVIEDTLSLSTDGKVSKQIASKVLEESSKFTTGATYKVYPSKGVVPFEDFKVGDWVLAPGDNGPKTRRRVSSISISENADTGAVEYDVEFDTVFQTRQQHLDKWMKSVLSGSMGGTVLSSKFKLPRVLTNRSGGSVFIEPPVINIQTDSVVTAGYFTPNGVAAASASLSWGVVDDQGAYVNPEDYKYDIYGVPDTDDPESVVLLASTTGSSATVRDLPPESEYTFRVAAKTSSGVETMSQDFTVELPKPGMSEPLPVPSEPDVETNVASVTVTWDGTYVGQNFDVVPPQITHVRAIASEVPGGPYVNRGPIIPKEGGTAVYAGLTQGVDWYVALITVDSLGNESVPSEEALIVVKGIDGNVDIELGTLNKDLLDTDILSELGDLASATRHGSLLIKNHSFESDESWDGELTPGVLAEPSFVKLDSEVRSNLVSDPSFTNLSKKLGGEPGNMLAGGGSTLTVDSDWSETGATALKISPGTTKSSAAYLTGPTITDKLTLDKWGGKTITVSATIRLADAMPDYDPTPENPALSISVSTDVSGVREWAYANSEPALPEAGMTRLSVNFTLPEGTGTDFWFLRLFNGSTVIPVWWDSLTVEEGETDGAYFENYGAHDGDRVLGKRGPTPGQELEEFETLESTAAQVIPINYSGKFIIRAYTANDLDADAGRSAMTVVMEDKEAPGVYTELGTASSSIGTGTWEELLIEFETPEIVTGPVKVVLRTQAGGPSSYSYIDDITLYDTTSIITVGGNVFSVNPPSGEGDGVGTLWYQYEEEDHSIIGMWSWDGTLWQPMEIRNEVIANLDAGKITTGFLDTNRIEAESLTVTHLSSSVGSDLNISSNQDIIFSAGRSDELEGRIDSTDEVLREQTSVFIVTEDGARVASGDGLQYLQMTPGSVALVLDGVEVSRWETGRFYVNEAVFNSARIGNHVFEAGGLGRTTVRPI